MTPRYPIDARPLELGRRRDDEDVAAAQRVPRGVAGRPRRGRAA